MAFSNIPAACIFMAEDKHVFQHTLSETPRATAALVGDAIKYTLNLKQPKNVVDLGVFMFKVKLFAGPFRRGIAEL